MSPSVASPLVAGDIKDSDPMTRQDKLVALRARSPWSMTLLTLFTSLAGIVILASILRSASTRHVDPKGCRMSYMRPSYAKLRDFDTEHTRFASKYSLYLYREEGLDNSHKVWPVPQSPPQKIGPRCMLILMMGACGLSPFF